VFDWKKLRILDSFGARPQNVSDYEAAVRSCNTERYQVDTINHRRSLDIVRAWNPYELDMLYRNRNRRLLNFYDHVERLCEEVDVFIVNHENPYHPEFIRALSQKTYTVLYTGDDPESSYLCSQPYAWAFDHTLCYAVNYDSATRMTDKLMQWGAKRADIRPFGFQPHRYDSTISEKELFAKMRNIEILYVGGPYNKVSDLMRLKKEFGKRFKIYGNWGGLKSTIGRFRRHGVFELIKPLSESDFIYTYQHSKIGINMHMSYGPSNVRMWELPINGVMQITDNPAGTAEFFDVGKEIACYENGGMEKAINLIDYFLCHEAERIEVARAGYRKVISRYSFKQTFLNSMIAIENGMNEKANESICRI